MEQQTINRTALASYATFSAMCESQKDLYEVISLFIAQTIREENIRRFTVRELNNKIKNLFTFNIPDSIIKTALKRIEYITRNNHQYIVGPEFFSGNMELRSSLNEAKKQSEEVLEMLINYIKKQKPNFKDSDRDIIVKSFCSLIFDNSVLSEYSQYIGGFILRYNDNEKVASFIKKLEEGCIWFQGLNYSYDGIQQQTWCDESNFFITQEIIFYLAGYNGDIYKSIAEDLFLLIKEMNKKAGKCVINVFFFEDTMQEIDKFFSAAERIIDGRDIKYNASEAMEFVVKSSKNITGLKRKQAELLSVLKSWGIREWASHLDFYSDENKQYNIIDSKFVTEAFEESDNLVYINSLNYIGILRKGLRSTEYRKTRFLLVTEMKRTLQAAKNLCSQDKIYTIPLAVNLGIITNRLWFDLNKGFGAKLFPKNLDTILKAKILLSELLNTSVSNKLEEANDDNIMMDEETLGECIALLRQNKKRPDEIDSENVDEIIELISEDSIADTQTRLVNQRLKSKKMEENIDKFIKESEIEYNSIEEKKAAIYDKMVKHNSYIKDKLRVYDRRLNYLMIILCVLVSTMICIINFVLDNTIWGYLIALPSMVWPTISSLSNIKLPKSKRIKKFIVKLLIQSRVCSLKWAFNYRQSLKDQLDKIDNELAENRKRVSSFL